MMRKVWIVCANKSRAKVLYAENVDKLCEFRSLEHKESHEKAKDLVADKRGRTNSRVGFGMNSLEEKTTPQEKEAHHFAAEIAHMLDEAHKSGEFERLYLIANPPFVAVLKGCLKPAIVKLIEKEIHKDLTLSKSEQIREYLPPVL
ncbi:MAG: host attachment protein [Chlamydiales bacterium]